MCADEIYTRKLNRNQSRRIRMETELTETKIRTNKESKRAEQKTWRTKKKKRVRVILFCALHTRSTECFAAPKLDGGNDRRCALAGAITQAANKLSLLDKPRISRHLYRHLWHSSFVCTRSSSRGEIWIWRACDHVSRRGQVNSFNNEQAKRVSRECVMKKFSIEAQQNVVNYEGKKNI